MKLEADLVVGRPEAEADVFRSSANRDGQNLKLQERFISVETKRHQQTNC